MPRGMRDGVVTAFQCLQLAPLCATTTSDHTCHFLGVLFSSELASCLVPGTFLTS